MSHLKPRTASVVIYQGDDLETLAEKKRAVVTAEQHARKAQDSGEARAGDDFGVEEARAAYNAFVDEAAQRALVIELRGIGKKRWRDLLAAHPARMVPGEDGKDVTHEDDELFQANTETFPDALLAFIDGDVRTIASPEFPTPAAAREFCDNELTEGDFVRVWNAAYWLNRAPGGDPAMGKYSTGIPTSTET